MQRNLKLNGDTTLAGFETLVLALLMAMKQPWPRLTVAVVGVVWKALSSNLGKRQPAWGQPCSKCADLFGIGDGSLSRRMQAGALEIPCHFCKLKKRNDTCEKNLILM